MNNFVNDFFNDDSCKEHILTFKSFITGFFILSLLVPFYVLNANFRLDFESVEFSEKFYWFLGCFVIFVMIELFAIAIGVLCSYIVYISNRFWIVHYLRKHGRVYSGTSQ